MIPITTTTIAALNVWHSFGPTQHAGEPAGPSLFARWPSVRFDHAQACALIRNGEGHPISPHVALRPLEAGRSVPWEFRAMDGRLYA